jgi:hypothetical protein
VALWDAFEGNVCGAEILFGAEGVVCAAMQGEVFGAVRAEVCEWVSVVKLQLLSFAAARSQGVDIGAAGVVTLVHRPANRSGDVPAALARGFVASSGDRAPIGGWLSACFRF